MKEIRELKGIAEQISREGDELFMTLTERLMMRGWKEGWEEGWEEGWREGRKVIIKIMAIEMLKDKIDIHLVAKYTKLTIEEIKDLKSSIQ